MAAGGCNEDIAGGVEGDSRMGIYIGTFGNALWGGDVTVGRDGDEKVGDGTP